MKVIDKGYREYKLDNGLVVALQDTSTQTVSARLRVNFGSYHEGVGEEGLAHYLEHCLVTGGSEGFDPKKADEIRTSFGYSKAFTSVGRTFFIGEMLNEDLETWMRYTSDHVFKPRFDEKRINGERERVLREISDTKSNPIYLPNKEFRELFYRGHPKGKFILGDESVVKNADSEIMRKFYSKGYNPNNMDLILVGGLPQEIDELVLKYFDSFASGDNMRKKFLSLFPLPEKVILRRHAPERLNVDNPFESSAQISLQYGGPVINHKDQIAANALNQLLGGDTNSYLFQNVGLKKGLAYNIQINMDGSYNAGEMGIEAIVPARRIDEAVNAIFEEMDRIKTVKVPENSINRIRRLKKYHLANTLETNKGRIFLIESKLDYGITSESIMAGFDKVTPKRVLDVANTYLPDKDDGKYFLCVRNPLM